MQHSTRRQNRPGRCARPVTLSLASPSPAPACSERITAFICFAYAFTPFAYVDELCPMFADSRRGEADLRLEPFDGRVLGAQLHLKALVRGLELADARDQLLDVAGILLSRCWHVRVRAQTRRQRPPPPARWQPCGQSLRPSQPLLSTSAAASFRHDAAKWKGDRAPGARPRDSQAWVFWLAPIAVGTTRSGRATQFRGSARASNLAVPA